MSWDLIFDVVFVLLASVLGVVLVRAVQWLRFIAKQDAYFLSRRGRHRSFEEREFNSRASFELDSDHLRQFSRLLVWSSVLFPALLLVESPHWLSDKDFSGQIIVLGIVLAVVVTQVVGSRILLGSLKKRYGRA